MKLFIIGNGFDLAHNLPTQYWDFRQFLEKYHPKFLHEFEQHYLIYPRDSDEVKRNILWKDFEANLANIEEDIIIEDAVSLDLNLESGDIGIEDTLYAHFTEEYEYIKNLAKYLTSWVKSIKVIKAYPRTSYINCAENNFYITFNYTSTLEKVYKIRQDSILHIHGSLHYFDSAPIIGHVNMKRIEDIKQKIERAEREFSEKEISIYKVIYDYYCRTFKDITRFMHKLQVLENMKISDINVFGHSIVGADLPYFKFVDEVTCHLAKWNVFFHAPEERIKIKNALIGQGIDDTRLEMYPSDEFINDNRNN